MNKHQHKTRRDFNNLCESISAEELSDPRIVVSIMNALRRIKESDQQVQDAQDAQMGLFPDDTDYRAWKANMLQARLL